MKTWEWSELLLCWRKLWGTGRFAGRGRTVRCAGLFDTATHAGNWHSTRIRGEPSEVARLILSEVGVVAGVSIALALPTALVLSGYLRSQLLGISNNDPLTLVATTALVAAMALLAASIPMRRAAKVDPMVALRYE